MIKTLDLIGWICLLLGALNTYGMFKKGYIITFFNVISYLLVSVLVWVANFYYVDELNLNGSYLPTIFIVVQVIFVFVSFFQLMVHKKNRI